MWATWTTAPTLTDEGEKKGQSMMGLFTIGYEGADLADFLTRLRSVGVTTLPFDRLLIAQSRSEPLLFLTADTKLARYGETVRVL